MTLSKYDTDFANAMALKLRLNREAKQLRRLNEFRLEIVKKQLVATHVQLLKQFYR